MLNAKVSYGGKMYLVYADHYDEVDSALEIPTTNYDFSLTEESGRLEDVLLSVRGLLNDIESAEEYILSHEYEKASIRYEMAAVTCRKIKSYAESRDFYAYAAILREKTEKWRYISYLWYKASETTESDSTDSIDYKDYNGLFHSYPTISFEKWNMFGNNEKTGRALQYSAFSEDNYNGPTDSYWLYEKAVDAFESAHDYGRMIECLVSATNRYVTNYNTLPDIILDKWKNILKSDEITAKHNATILLAFEEIYKRMNRYESERAKFFYIEAQNLRMREFKNKKEYFKALKMWIWKRISEYNTSVYKIVVITLLLVLVVFPLLFTFVTLGNENISFVDSIRVSINNFLGVETINNGSLLFYCTGVVEVLFSYFMLVIISTHLIAKAVKDLD